VNTINSIRSIVNIDNNTHNDINNNTSTQYTLRYYTNENKHITQ